MGRVLARLDCPARLFVSIGFSVAFTLRYVVRSDSETRISHEEACNRRYCRRPRNLHSGDGSPMLPRYDDDPQLPPHLGNTRPPLQAVVSSRRRVSLKRASRPIQIMSEPLFTSPVSSSTTLPCVVAFALGRGVDPDHIIRNHSVDFHQPIGMPLDADVRSRKVSSWDVSLCASGLIWMPTSSRTDGHGGRCSDSARRMSRYAYFIVVFRNEVRPHPIRAIAASNRACSGHPKATPRPSRSASRRGALAGRP